MQDKLSIQIFAGAVAAGAWCAFYLGLNGLGPSPDRSTPEATGLVLAQQVKAVLPPGGQVTVIARDTIAFKNPASDFQLENFQRQLRKAHIPLRSVHRVQVDPLRPVEVPPGDFLELLRKVPENEVIVSFMGPPVLAEEQRRQLGNRQAFVLAFCPGSMAENVDLRSVFDQGLLRAAVVARRPRSVSTGKPSTVQEWFDRSFLLVTAANLGALPPPLVERR